MSDPIALYQEWFANASEANLPFPEAAGLSSCTPDGRPSSRMVLIKEVDKRGFEFYTNYGSRKALELDANPHAALLWHWPHVQRQVRVEGTVARLDPAESEAYFKTRPLGSRIGAWASRQSAELADRAELEAKVERYEKEFGADPPLPPFWGGYRLTPRLFEFWEGRADRLHDRMEYVRQGDGWVTRRLNP